MRDDSQDHSLTPQAITRARWAVAAFFFTNGALYANMAPRFPEIKAALGLSDALYGLSIAAFAAGALTAGLAAAPLIRRFGAPTVAVLSTAFTGLAILGTGLSPIPALFAFGLFVAGAMDAITDVAQNDHGLHVQEAMGKSILNGFHATWSLGAVTGGFMASAAIALALPLQAHLALSALLFSLVAFVASRFCLPGSRVQRPPRATASDRDQPTLAEGQDGDSQAHIAQHEAGTVLGCSAVILLIGISAMTILSTMVEDLGSSWASLYLREGIGVSGQVAAFGLVAVAGSQFLGRLLGDVMVDRWGPVNVARLGGALVAVGMGAALAIPSPALTFVGFMAAGFGVATLVPSAFHAADTIPGFQTGTALTIVAWLMRVTVLATPPLIGYLADQTSLRLALTLIPLMGVGTSLLAPVLAPRRPRSAR